MEKKKDNYDYLTHSASTQDCTGLIPTIPLNLDEVESYEQIYPFLPPRLNTSSEDD